MMVIIYLILWFIVIYSWIKIADHLLKDFGDKNEK